MTSETKLCTAPGDGGTGECGRKVQAKGLCTAHVHLKRRREKELAALASAPLPPLKAGRTSGRPMQVVSTSLPAEVAETVRDVGVKRGALPRNAGGEGLRELAGAFHRGDLVPRAPKKTPHLAHEEES